LPFPFSLSDVQFTICFYCPSKGVRSTWGYAITSALKIKPDEFASAYTTNLDRANEEVILTQPVISALITLLQREEGVWSWGVSQLYTKLNAIAKEEGVNTASSLWPGSASALSRKLSNHKSNLEDAGFEFEIRSTGRNRQRTFRQKGSTPEPVGVANLRKFRKKVSGDNPGHLKELFDDESAQK
jgi:hypothetical protein